MEIKCTQRFVVGIWKKETTMMDGVKIDIPYKGLEVFNWFYLSQDNDL
jgi:hypothetical protein